MANKNAAKKDIRQTKTRTLRNAVLKKRMKEAVKAATKAIEAGEASAKELIDTAYKAIDKAAKRNIIHDNKAGRMKAALQKALNAKK